MTKTAANCKILYNFLLMDFNEELSLDDTVLLKYSVYSVFILKSEVLVLPRPLPSPEPPVGGGLGPAPSGDRQHFTGVKADKNRLSPT